MISWSVRQHHGSPARAACSAPTAGPCCSRVAESSGPTPAVLPEMSFGRASSWPTPGFVNLTDSNSALASCLAESSGPTQHALGLAFCFVLEASKAMPLTFVVIALCWVAESSGPTLRVVFLCASRALCWVPDLCWPGSLRTSSAPLSRPAAALLFFAAVFFVAPVAPAAAASRSDLPRPRPVRPALPRLGTLL